MVKKNIEILVTKTGLNGEISSIKDGKIIKSIPAVIFSKDEANRLFNTIYSQGKDYQENYNNK